MPPTPVPLDPSLIEEPVAALLTRLAAGWSPPPYVPDAVVSVRAGGQDATGSFLGLRRDGDELEVRYRDDARSMGAGYLIAGDIEADLADGGLLEAEAHGSTFEFATSETTVRCRRWTVRSDAAVAWVGRLIGTEIERGTGNVRVVRREANRTWTTEDHLRVESPDATLYVLRGRDAKPTWLIVCPRGTFDARQTWRDQMLLRTLLATSFGVDGLTAVDAAGAAVGAWVDDRDTSARAVGSGRPPLVPTRPTGRWGRLTWVAPLFERVSARYSLEDEPDPVTTAVYRYGHSLGPVDPDTELVLVASAVWVVLRGMAAGHGSALPPHPLVREVAAALEKAAESGDSARFESAVETLTVWSQTRERALLEEIDPDAGAHVFRELAAARDVWDRGLVRGPDGEASPTNGIATWGRVQRLRRAFAVLLAREVGYGGPVVGEEAHEDGTTDWLRGPEAAENTEAAAAARYVAASSAEVSSAWPEFIPPGVPETPTVQALVRFADGLRERTDGAVTARLRPLPRRDGEPRRLSFRLLLGRVPSVHVALFSVEVEADGVVVTGWDDGAVRLEDSEAVAVFGDRVASSEEMRYQVERLLLIGEDVLRGEVRPETR